MNLAVYGSPGGGLVIGEGPFERRADPPAAGWAFYRNDFALSSANPWQVPAKVTELGAGDPFPVEKRGGVTVQWEEPEVDPFAEVYAEVSQAIRGGTIEKSVPVVTARGCVKRGSPLGLLHSLEGVKAPLRPYAWIEGKEGFAGLSPELLFRLQGDALQTMALAGTARREERDAFGVDEKEIREHEFVAQTLLAKLSDLGRTTRYPREIMDLDRLVHFHSGIDLELARREPVDRLVRVLHPTPALGPLPRTEETMAQLLAWRAHLGCPPWFGAPFGLWREGSFEVLVAIRMVAWSGSEVLIPSGCGVIDESRLVNEWRELRLKREAVREAFGL